MIKFQKTTTRMSALVLSTLLTAGIAGCDNFKSAESLVADAKQLQQKGDTKAAIIHLKSAIQKSPDNAEPRYLLGAIYNKIGDAVSAEKELSKALSLGFDKNKVLPELGQALLSLGKFKEVLEETKSIAGDNEPVEISIARGNAHLALQDAASAKTSFELALKNKADHPLALVGMARLALFDKNIDEAMRLVELAASKNPDDTASRMFKGDLLRAQGKIDLALDAYSQIIKIQPNNGIAYVNKAYLEIATGKYTEAKKDLDAARKFASGNLSVAYTQALLDFRQNNFKASLESLQQVLKVAPDHLPSVLLMGAVQLALGSLPQAEEHLKKYLDKDPHNLYARKVMTSVLLKQRRIQRALEILEPALKDAPSDPQLLSLAGELFMQTGEFAKASDYFAKAGEIAPKVPQLHSALALSKLAQGKHEQAISELETASTLDVQSSKSSVLLITTLMRLQQYDKALAAIADLEKKQANDPLVHNLRGGVYVAKKDIAAARASFEKTLSIQSDNIAAVMNLVQLDMHEKKTDAAKKRLEAVLEKDKKNVQIMHALAGLAVAQGKVDEATSWFTKASEANPDAIQPALALAGHYLKINKKKDALNLVQRLQGAHTDSAELLDVLAQVQLANDDKQAALDTYGRLVALAPKSANAHYRLAMMQMTLKNEKAAIDSLNKALSIQPEHVDAQKALAVIDAGKGNFTNALAIAQKMQLQHPKSSEGYELEANLFLAQKKLDLAAKSYSKALSINKNFNLLLKLHAILTQSGQGKVADAQLTQWLKDYPNDLAAHAYQADLYLARKQHKAAIEKYEFVLKHNPQYVPALNNLAVLYYQEKDARALATAEKAQQLAPKAPAVLDTLGWMLIEQGNVVRGLPYVQEAAKLLPDAAEIQYHLVVGLMKAGDKTKAREELGKLLSSGKKFPQLDEARALQKQL